MPATPTGRGAQVILTGAVRRAARGAAANSLHGNLDIKTNLELAGSISAGYSPDGRTATLAPAHDVTVLAPESELGDALGSGGGGGGPFLPTAGGTVAGPLTVTGQSLFNFVNGTQPIIFQGNAGLPSGPPGGVFSTPAATTTQPIGGIEAMGYDTTWTTTPNANVMLVSAGTWSAASHPAYITFGTTPINSVTLTEAGRFSPNGNLLLGLTTDGANKLDVVGAVRLNGSLGVFNTTPVAKQTVSGAKGSNAALASLIAALAAYGLITDTTGA